MTTTLGTRLGTILGTDLATFTDGLVPAPTFDTSKTYALTNYQTSNRYTTPAGGGEAGDVGGFGMLVLGILEKVPATTQTIAGRVTGTSGYIMSTDPTAPSFVATSARDGGGTSVGTRLNTGLTFAPSDVGRVVPTVLTYGSGWLSTIAWDGSLKRSVALATYSPAAGTTFTQMGPGGTDTAYAPFAMLTYRGTPSDAQLRAVLAEARTLGDVPTKATAEALMPGTTVTHRWSLRGVLQLANVPVNDNAAAPATIPDSVTTAPVDAMAKTGTPVVRVIDPSVDGRMSYGALGFSATSHLKTSVAILNAPTMSVELRVTFTSALASGKHILSNATGSSAVGGFSLYQSANTLNLYSYGAGAQVASVVIPATDIGYPRTIKAEYTGTVWRLYLDGVQQGADSAVSYTPSARDLYIGTFGDGTSPSDNMSFWSLRTGTLASPSQHYYDLTQDIAPAPQSGIPAQVLDRVGSDHLTRVDGFATVTNGSATGLRGFTSANVLSTPGGFAGAASGFWASVLFAPQTLTGVRILFAKSNHNTAGWAIGINGQYIVTYVADAGALVAGPQFNLGAGVGYLNTATHVAMVLSGGTLTLYVNGTAAGTPLTVTTYNPGTTNMVLGATNGGVLYPAIGCDIFGAAGGHFVPTAGEIAAASASSLSSGSIAAVAAKTSHRYDLKADIATAGGVPTTSLERTSGVDSLSVSNAKLEVAQRVERTWSYESAPILYGARDFSPSDCFEVATSVGDSNTQSFWAAALFTPYATSVSKNRDLFGSLSLAALTSGFTIRVYGANTSIAFLAADAAGTGRNPTVSTLAATDMGKTCLYLGVYDQTALKLRGYTRRLEAGTGFTVSGYTPASSGLRIGRSFVATDTSAPDIAMHGVAAGLGLPTLAQVQAFFDATMANERIASIAGMTSLRIDIDADIRANGGAIPTTLVDRQSGTFNFTRTGAPTVAQQYARAWVW